ncbi:MAG: hypothetical protein EA381_04490 [Planctomycetaceae bacterium]|nr:MAG: hypothetical protein EA381_04490 [Planctomycetaceae bacterium]
MFRPVRNGLAAAAKPLMLAGVLVGFCGWSIASASANQDLQEGLSRLAKAVKTSLEDEGVDAVNVGDFIAPPRLQSGSGTGLKLQIVEALKAAGVRVEATAPTQLIGRFTVREEQERDEDAFESIALRITATLLDRDDEELARLNISVFGDSALQLVGAQGSLPPTNAPREREASKREAIEAPLPTIAGNEVRTSADSPFGLEVLVTRGSGAEPRRPELEPAGDRGQRAFVRLANGDEYVVRLHNRSATEVAVTLTIDGLSMFAFSETGNFGSQVLVPPGGRVDIPGWFINDRLTDAFEVSGYAKSAAASVGVPVTDVGTITAAFYESVPGSEKDAQATARGRQIEKRYVQVKRIIKDLQAVISVRYHR